MNSRTLFAGRLKVGDFVRVPDEPGWWEIVAMFFEGPNVIDLDLWSATREDDFSYNWHVGAREQVELRG
jgi:hypothetical protein